MKENALVNRFLALLIVLFFAACGGCQKSPPVLLPEPEEKPKSLFVLLPEQDGEVGQITVSNPEGEQVLNKAWQATAVESAGKHPSAPMQLDEQEVAETFGEALAAQPQRPAHFILYFESGSTELTAASRELVRDVLKAIAERASVDTSVVGHTDTAGAADLNYKLALQRAELVAKILTSQGVDPEILEIKSHGEGDPLVLTADGVSEPRNRRVEVTVR
jgi:outer membrane protein OmpA-like peptidoglycan-associated protein